MLSSIILGLSLGILIVYMNKKPLYHGPNSNIIRNNIYFDSKTNTFFKLIPTICDSR
jgi:hypothetical protein